MACTTVFPRFARPLTTTRASPARRAFSASARANAAYGFIGLGRMGLPMAKNLRAKIDPSDTLIVHDVNEESVKSFMSEHGDSNTQAASDVREVAEKSDTLLTSLPEPSHVKSVFDAILSPGPLPPTPSSSQNKTRLYIDHSTIDPITSRSIARSVSAASAGSFIDAPMSGGVVGAQAGTLTFMLGCPPELLERATAVLSLMGKRVVHLGDQGAGLCGKLANNYALALNNIATAEAMSMGIQFGLDAKALAGMMNTSTGKSWPSEVNNPVPGVIETSPASRGYEGGFGISLMAKDLRLALDSVKEFGVRNGLGERALEMYRSAMEDERCRGKDFSSIYRWLEGPEGRK